MTGLDAADHALRDAALAELTLDTGRHLRPVRQGWRQGIDGRAALGVVLGHGGS